MLFNLTPNSQGIARLCIGSHTLFRYFGTDHLPSSVHTVISRKSGAFTIQARSALPRPVQRQQIEARGDQMILM